MIHLGGLPFEIVAGAEPLHASESAWIARVKSPVAVCAADPFAIEVVPVSPEWRVAMDAYPADTPAHIGWADPLVVVTHRGFRAELDPFRRHGRFCRTISGRGPLEVAVKVGLCCWLPLLGGVPIHGAGIVLGQAGAGLFFGPSGAGKSTLAGLAEDPVLSDELVAVREEDGRFGARATGFWGTLNREDAPLDPYHVRGLFELKQERATRIAPVSPHAMLRKLLGVAIVPPAPPLWSHVVRVLSRLAESAPGYELGWSKDAPPWTEIRAVVGISPDIRLTGSAATATEQAGPLP